MSAFLTVFQPVTYSLENGIYTSIIGPVGAASSAAATVTQDKVPVAVVQPNVKGESKKVIDPFDPEATVPLPFQLDDQFGPYSTSVWKRNERERCRVRCVNEGYDRLRTHLPLHDGEKRISKVDTLRLAIRYIRHLDNLLKNQMHQYNCKCFAGFQEESEGNIQVNFQYISN